MLFSIINFLPSITSGFLANKDGQILLIAGLIVLYLFIFIFWLVMLIDAVKNREIQGSVWIIIIALVGFIGSLIYYFVVKRRRTKKVPATEPVMPDSNSYYLGGTTKDDVVQE